jgi:hypothetical protein
MTESGFAIDLRKPQYPHQNAGDEDFNVVEELLKGCRLGIGRLVDQEQLKHDESQGEEHSAVVEGVNFEAREFGKVLDPQYGQNRKEIEHKKHPNESGHLQLLKAEIKRGQSDLRVD